MSATPTKQADRIRAFVARRIAAPAHAAGRSRFLVRAGDVHRAMGLFNALPSICSAIGSRKFETIAMVRLVHHEGPHAGSNAIFEFEFLEDGLASRTEKEPFAEATWSDILVLNQSMRAARHEVDFTDSVCLISCVKSKQESAAPARELYVSQWFRDARNLVEASGAQWYVLSALYGCVEPERVIQPYDYTLNRLGVADRKAWARQVLDALIPKLVDKRRVIMFAGQRYREFLVGPLREAGFEVVVPMEGLRQGEQRAWLSRLR